MTIAKMDCQFPAKMLENDINVLGHTYCNAGCSKTIIINRVGKGRG
jgi:hypothetical protein